MSSLNTKGSRMTIRKSNGRKLIQLSVRPEFYELIRDHCERLDMPVTVWARELIKRELERE
jgi:hypothetical protein